MARVLLALGLATSAAQQGPLQRCRLPSIEEELLCGKLTVPENRQTRVGRTIDLNVVVLPALDQKAKDAQLFDLAGDPGVSGRVCRDAAARVGKESRPDAIHGLDREGRCAAWLGYERINLFGLSYGTPAALVYMRQHSERVPSAVLMGVAPIDLKMPLHHARAAKRAMDLLLDDCAGDAKCSGAFPEIRREWEEVVARLRADPARVPYAMPDGSGNVTVEIPADIFAENSEIGCIHRAARGSSRS